MCFSNQWLAKPVMLVCGFTFFLANCRDKTTQPGKTPLALQITAAAFAILSGGKLQLSAIASFADGATNDVTAEAIWSNSPGHVGTVHPGGLFIAANDSTGIETVRANYQGQSATVQIEVIMRARSLTIWPVLLLVEKVLLPGKFTSDVLEANSPAQNPTGPGPTMPIGPLAGGTALWRGGAWITGSQLCRAAFRGTIPDQADHNYLSQAFVDFRVARSLQ